MRTRRRKLRMGMRMRMGSMVAPPHQHVARLHGQVLAQ
jgi:hypothetical protein